MGRIAGYYLRVASLSRRGKHRVAKRICNYLRFSSMLLQNYVKTACGPFCFV
ncbi:hypothetical protein AVM39_002781 [Salmonella enterica subsp. enterica serovar Saintpaul]|uniref:Uncharacterized protein n=2 Tax=Salmonella enterica TaxID=28901 RepID=A0A746XTN8_SALER|nr:hypothetical protein [Salmonella enterica subsp. enterica serovar 4,[5],12:i:-]EDT1334781.1 hypothetical protein [Salmonella enterica subsp. enterica]EDT8383655.1 hypothetical protein [Salmonella enterica subsp. enterica serovar Copenhagen]EDU9869867.1 hypothetical protein [Salmonella enterica]EDX5286029.1 hypothetical protein [Salmonella enterica subsp. enterica serovar Javiana]EED8272469.1 hypothetical protein [Salmonella enterica subsp. enterica serovar Saintpaul]EEG7201880.1 hypothetic